MCTTCQDKRYTDRCLDCKRAYHAAAKRKQRDSGNEAPKRPNQRPKNKAARHAYVSRKKPGFDRLPYRLLKEVSAVVNEWNDRLFSHARTKVQRAGSVCEEPLRDTHNNLVLDERGRAVMMPVCPFCHYCRREGAKGYGVLCAWNDTDMIDAVRIARGRLAMTSGQTVSED